MIFQLISSTGIKFDEDVYEVLVPTKDGEIAILADHMPLMSAGAPGVLRIRKKASDANENMESFAVYGGIIQVDGQSARFVTDDVTAPDDISEKEAQEALERAKQLVEKAASQVELQEAREIVQRHEVHLGLAR